MNDEIKVGSYIRTKENGICKLLANDVNANGNYTGYVDRPFWLRRKNIVKHRPNIIDLVEVGDLVEIEYHAPRYEERVTRLFEVVNTNMHIVFRNVHCELIYTIANNEWAFGDKKLKPIIKGIVTKEQMEKIMYKVGE